MRSGGLAILIVVLGGLWSTAADPPREVVRAVEDQTRKVIDAAESSVVAVVVSHARYPAQWAPDRQFPGRLGKYVAPDVPLRGPFRGPMADPKLNLADPQTVPDHMFGSGIVLDTDGLILTTYHLIEGASKVYVRSASGRGSYADIHAADARSDLVVLKLIDPTPGLKPIKIAEVRLVEGPAGEKPNIGRGSWVIALGHPAGSGLADGVPSASYGIISGVRRRAGGPVREEHRNRPLYQYASLLQTDARIALGCSGGLLVNMDGEAVGLTSPVAAVTGAETAGGFAIPFEPNYRRIIDVLRAGREVEYGFLGVTINNTTGRLEHGLMLANVTPGTPAAAAGLMGSDILTAIDGTPIHEQDDLFHLVGAALAGTKIKLTVVRGGNRAKIVDVGLTKFHHPQPWLASARPPATHGLRIDYSSVLLLQMQQAQDQKAGQDGLPSGVFVRELEPGSPAEARFKALGQPTDRWLITAVNGKPIATPADYYREVAGKNVVQLKLVDPTAPERERDLQLP